MQNISEFLSFTMFGAFTWFIVATLVLLFLFFYSEYEEQGFIAFAAVIAYVLVNHYFGNLPLIKLVTFTNCWIYFSMGFIYSIMRTFIYGRGLSEFNSYAVSELKGNVFRWWFLWPISLISWIVSDLFKDLWEFVYSKFRNGFEYVLKAGFNSKKR